MKEETEYGSNTVRVDHVLTQSQRLYGRVSWFDRNSNYNNYFDNISTGQWFRFVSRQVVVRSRLDDDPTHGHERAVRLRPVPSRRPGQPGNFGMDLTSAGLSPRLTTT